MGSMDGIILDLVIMKLVMEFEVREDGADGKEALEIVEHTAIEMARRLNTDAIWDEEGGSRKLDEPRFIINIVTMWDPND